MQEVKALEYHDKPSYEKLRSILQAGLKAIQAKDDGKLEFTTVNGAATSAKVSAQGHNPRPKRNLIIAPSRMIPPYEKKGPSVRPRFLSNSQFTRFL